eukprot:IDg12414t1
MRNQWHCHDGDLCRRAHVEGTDVVHCCARRAAHVPLLAYVERCRSSQNEGTHQVAQGAAMEPGIVAGVSITAAVAFRSLLDRVRRAPATQASPITPPTSRVPRRTATTRVFVVPGSRHDSTVITGNMVLATIKLATPALVYRTNTAVSNVANLVSVFNSALLAMQACMLPR